MSCLYHDIPGRLRVKIPAIKHKPHSARKMEKLFQALPGVLSVCANDTTGSLKILYDPEEVHAADFIDVLKQRGYVDETGTAFRHGDDYRTATRAAQAIGKVLMNLAVSRTLEASGLGLLAAII